MQGYRAVFWMCFGALGVVVLVGAVGLRGVGVVGGKERGRSDEGARDAGEP